MTFSAKNYLDPILTNKGSQAVLLMVKNIHKKQFVS